VLTPTRKHREIKQAAIGLMALPTSNQQQLRREMFHEVPKKGTHRLNREWLCPFQQVQTSNTSNRKCSMKIP
jgi:hypothetical protein